jgi:TolA-binding protein
LALKHGIYYVLRTHDPCATDFPGDTMKRALVIALSLAISASVFAQTDTGAAKPKTTRKSSARPASKDIQELKDAIAAQQQQIQQLQQQIQSRDTAIQTLQQQVGDAQSAATQAQQTANAAVPKAEDLDKQYFDPLQHDVTDLKTLSANQAEALQETQKRVSGLESPLAIHYKGITITPGGFLAAETVWRQRAEGADINTNLNGIPYPGASQAHMSEFYGSGRQSRISMLAQGKLENMNLTGYLEADFLGAGVTSNNNQSNSYVLRQRQVWGQAALNSGWNFTGGQMWSLVTETRVGEDNRTEALPMTIDPQYTVGFSWARQYAFRVTKNYHNKLWFGFSVENSQETLTTHGNTSNSFLLGSQGNAGGLYNPAINSCSTTLNSAGNPVTTCTNVANYSFNASPDLIGKLVFQPGFGHYEIFGIATEFRDRIFPNAGATTPSAAGAFNSSTWTGGGGGNARWSVLQKHVELGIHALAGRGVGRYGTSGLSDVTINPYGNIVPITSYQGLATLEYHSPKWDWYGYGGLEYDQRTAFLSPKNAPVGYGSAFFNNTGCSVETLPSSGLTAGFNPGSLSNCNADTKDIIEGTLGFWYKPYNGPKGRLQFGLQYSYLTKVAWTGFGLKLPAPPGASPTAIENMVFTSFRYYLP